MSLLVPKELDYCYPMVKADMDKSTFDFHKWTAPLNPYYSVRSPKDTIVYSVCSGIGTVESLVPFKLSIIHKGFKIDDQWFYENLTPIAEMELGKQYVITRGQAIGKTIGPEPTYNDWLWRCRSLGALGGPQDPLAVLRALQASYPDQATLYPVEAGGLGLGVLALAALLGYAIG